jgi:copper homeostasis protein
MTSVLVEACVDAIDAAREAEQGGAGRLELCGELLQGGVTPSAGLIEGVASKVKIPVCVLIRPRTGDFLYTDDEIDVMRRDVALCKSLGVAGVVFGALTSDGDVDVARMKALVELARPMSVTFHRAFDFTRDREWALDTLIDLGLDRVLTSGGAGTALEGASELSRLVHRAAERIAVMAGGSITSANVADVVRSTGVREVHVRGAEQVRSSMRHRHAGVTLVRPVTASDDARLVARAGQIRRIVASANER